MARSLTAADAFFEAMPSWEKTQQGLAQLLASDGPPEGRSWGEVTGTVLYGVDGRPATLGPLCQRVFGPLEDNRCRCGRFTGDTCRDQVCPKCGVLCGSSEVRTWRFGHLRLAAPVLHPALHLHVADVLGWELVQLHALLAGEASIVDGVYQNHSGSLEEAGMFALERALRRMGQTQLLLNVIPVLPAGDRPRQEVQHTSGRLSQRTHPMSEAYVQLLLRSQRFDQLRRLEAPLMILASEHDVVQHAFENLMIPAVRAGAAPVPHRIHIEPAENEEISGLWSQEDARSDMVVGALWLTDSEVLVQRRNRTAILSLGGELLSCWSSDSRIASWSSADGTQIAHVSRETDVDSDLESKTSTVSGAGVRVRESGIWLKDWPQDLPCSLVARGEPEDASVEDAHTGCSEALLPASDRPTLTAWSRDGACVWATDGGHEGLVRAADTGEVFAHIGKPEPRTGINRDGERFELEDDYEDFENTAEYGALGETEAGQWRVAWPDGVVGDGNRSFDLLAFDVGGLAWSPDASKLLVVTQAELMVLSVEDGQGMSWISHAPLPPFVL